MWRVGESAGEMRRALTRGRGHSGNVTSHRGSEVMGDMGNATLCGHSASDTGPLNIWDGNVVMGLSGGSPVVGKVS